jgi:hypothetical protein
MPDTSGAESLLRTVICGRVMDDDLRQKFAPRRNKRHAHLRGFDEEAKWGNALDWQTNEYDFYRLTRSIRDHLDSEYREKAGLRIDQLATAEEIEKMFRTCRAWYEEEKQVFERTGIYVFLRLNMDLWLCGKARDALDSRRENAERTAA